MTNLFKQTRMWRPNILHLTALTATMAVLPNSTAEDRFPPKLIPGHNGRILFQASTLDALSLGLYQGVFPISQLREHGDFGLGTFEGIDGEMTVLDGHFYHFRSDGTITDEADSTKVPFAVVANFKPDFRFETSGMSLDQLSAYLDQRIGSKNLFYALRIHGTLTQIETRAIPKLLPPYPPLSQAVTQEVTFPFANIKGTIVALRCPAYVKGLNQVGYHYHFISDDRNVGGHLLSFTTGPVTVEVEVLREQSIWLPENRQFLMAPLPVTN